MNMKRIIAVLGTVLLSAGLGWTPAIAAPVTVAVQTGTISATGQTTPLLVASPNGCYVVTAVATGSPVYTTVPQLSKTDLATGTYTTGTTINAGSITAAGSYRGIVPSSTTNVRLNTTALSGGTFTYTITCFLGTTTMVACTLTTGTAKVCAVGPGTFKGIANNGNAAQTATVDCFDNATTNSGEKTASIAALGATQTFPWPGEGKAFLNGQTCIASGTPTGAGIDIFINQ